MSGNDELTAQAISHLVEEMRLQRGTQGRTQEIQEQILEQLREIHRTDVEIRDQIGQIVEAQRDSNRRIALVENKVERHDERIKKLEARFPHNPDRSAGPSGAGRS